MGMDGHRPEELQCKAWEMARLVDMAEAQYAISELLRFIEFKVVD
jgi:hypothetical protein